MYVGGLVSSGEGLPTGLLSGEVRWWNYLYSTLVCVACLIVSLVGGAMFGKTTVFIFSVSCSTCLQSVEYLQLEISIGPVNKGHSVQRVP